jgi:probable rRNA maturation factor
MIEVEIEADGWLAAAPDAVRRVTAAAERTLALAEGPLEGEVTVLLTDDAELRGLNARFRDKDRPTNVLSFPAPDFAAPHLGDVALALETCAAEAKAQGKTLGDHLAHLVAHGVLHLLGWDHEIEAEAEAMEALERKVMAALGIADPYAASPEDDRTHGERRRPD